MKTTTVKLDGSILGWGSGGIARYLSNVLEHLSREPDLRIKLLANSKVPVTSIPGLTERDIRLKGGPLWRSTILQSDLLLTKPDVYWLTDASRPPFVPRPYVVTVHDLAPVIFPSFRSRLDNFAFSTVYRRAVTRADHVLAVSDATSRDLQKIWSVPPERITVTHLGVSGSFTPGDRSVARHEVEKRFDLRKPYALVVGTIEKRKGLDILVEIASATNDPVIVFAGRNGYGSEAVVESGAAAGARFLGEVNDAELVDLYRAAEVLLLPSVYEGFGLSGLEAMACGCPVVVAGGAGSLDEIYGDAAKVVRDRSVEPWLSAIEEVCSDRDRFIRAGLLVASRFTWAATASSVAEVFRQVAQQAGRTRSKPLGDPFN